MVKRKIIMERYSDPIHKGTLENAEMIERFSTQCVDKMKLFLKWEGNVLVNVKHDSVGCAVFLSSSPSVPTSSSTSVVPRFKVAVATAGVDGVDGVAGVVGVVPDWSSPPPGVSTVAAFTVIVCVAVLPP